MVRASLRVGLLALAFALATAAFGWWSVALLGAVWGGVAVVASRPGVTAGVAAGVGWVVLLAVTAAQGPVWDLAQRVGGVLALPGWLVPVVTVAFGVLLGGSAAELAVGARTWRGIGGGGVND
ncbi:MAG: hypothetical protein JSW43_01310 [Gemmatimonadota bacterium]|nr:MAG: hypothetical protein JSW43_01310 [Gemmatimonadota bacterium]